MFYRGLAPNLLFVAPEKALKLTLNDTIRDALKSPDEATLPLWKGIIAGGMAGLGQVRPPRYVVVNPPPPWCLADGDDGCRGGGVGADECFRLICRVARPASNQT